jgi:hypothetical protein
MKYKSIVVLASLLLFLLLNPIVNSQDEGTNENLNIIDDTTWKSTIYGAILIQLDPNSPQIEDIINNWNSPPKRFITNMDIIVPDPNIENGNLLFIHPLRSLMGGLFDLGPFFDPIAPKDTTLVYISILRCDLHYSQTDNGFSENFRIDGIGPLISWRN